MTMIRPETEMKDSGIQWLGNIPKEWSIIKGKYILKQLSRSVLESDNVVTCFRDGEVTLRSNRRELGFTNSLKEIGYQGVEPGDLVVHGMDGFAGAIGISDSRGKMSPIINVLESGECKKYLMYYLRGLAFVNVFLGLSTGIRERSCDLRWNKLANLEYTIPPLSEQQAIADYLDETCSKIDEIIAEAKASIDEYKELKQSVIDKAVLHGLCNGMMKDSGNDLIGKIPLSWEMRKLKYVADFNPGITTAYDAQKEVGYVPMNCVKNGYMNPLSARLSDMSTGLTGFQDGDIVIAKVTPCFENGNIAVAENLEQGVAFGSSELFVIRTHSINRRFMLYYLQNSVFKNQCISTMTGTGGLKRVSGYFVNNAYITYPPENEQQVIVNYLDEAVKNMDSLISEKESLINDLEEYKKSLIYEVVTGKRRVV